ncbi:MAG: pyridoxal-phosphate dependent enzyme [Bacteroidota bacterium]
MEYKNNILETIGNTPLIKINKITADFPCPVFIKNETFNPGHSIKDRMALKMLEDAEADGRLKPGGTIIECTSGNTGMGLALAGCVKGYRSIFTTSDKQSKEKIDLLKAVGAEVIVCPTNVTPEDPRSYYSVARRLSEEIPNSFWFNQYDNLSNRQAHYESTGPEIWQQTDGKITHMVVGVGTGGTVSGTGRYLKEQNEAVQIWGVDTYGSVFKKYHETGEFDEKEIYPYITEGIGEDILPKNVDFSIIDHFEKVTDKDGALMARRLAREEGMLLGYSAGSALAGLIQLRDKLSADDVVVVVIHDHGSRYIGKIYNDDWMRERGFLDTELQLSDLVAQKNNAPFIGIEQSATVRAAMEQMKDHDFSQMPVLNEQEEVVGALTESQVLAYLLDNPIKHSEVAIKEIMREPFPELDATTSITQLRHYISKENPAVIVRDRSGARHLIAQYDILQAM